MKRLRMRRRNPLWRDSLVHGLAIQVADSHVCDVLELTHGSQHHLASSHPCTRRPVPVDIHFGSDALLKLLSRRFDLPCDGSLRLVRGQAQILQMLKFLPDVF